MIENAIYAVAKGVPAVSTIVESRIYPDVAPDNEDVDTQLTRQAYMVYTIIGDNTEEVLEGASSLQAVRVQFAIFAPSASVCRVVRDDMKKELSVYSGIAADINVQAINLQNGFSLYQSATRQYVYTLDARFIYENYWKD